MKKRILSILLIFCMMLCLVPTGMFAEGETTRGVITEQELIDALADDTVDIVTLKSNIAVRDTLTVDRAVTLDLYGYMLENSAGGSVIKIENGGHLTLKDSDLTSTYYFNPEADGLWKWETSGTKTVNGGVIYGGTGSRNGDTVSGGGVYVDGGGTFTMTGGNIVGCTATIERVQAQGGGVYVAENGTFTMTGGSIAGCTAIAAQLSAYAMGGGICNEGTTTLSGTAEIRECRITHAGNLIGVGIYDSGTLNISGDVKIIGCRAEGLQAEAMYTNIGGTINGGFFDGSVWSHSTITDGTFNGEVINSDTITGGIFKGKVTNGGPISGGMFYGGITEGGVIRGCTVTYRVDGKDYAMQVLPGGETALKPDDPAKDGHIFMGWYDGDMPYDFTRPVTGNMTLTAKLIKIADKTADFTASDGGAAAIDLLNTAKTGSADSTWDNGTKTLTLNGVSFITTATTAVKLPDGATVILADGTENRIIGGGATAAQDGTYNNKIYIYGIYTAGALTVQGEKDGTGTLYVNSGEHINSGDAWTYSIALCMNGDLAVRSGSVTARGGKASCTDGGFSYGIEFAKNADLSITGGTLTAVGGEALDTKDPYNVKKAFSASICTYIGDITVSGNGKLIAENVPSMAGGGLSYGLDIVSGDLTVKDNASVSVTAGKAINISGGSLRLSGGKLRAFTTRENSDAIAVTKDLWDTKDGCIEISGGEFECIGNIYMYQTKPNDTQGLFSVTGGKVTAGYIFGPNKLTVSNGSVTSRYISAKTVELSGGNLTVREPVYENSSTGTRYVSSAISCGKLSVSSGTLDAAWDWGKYTPSVFSADSYWGYPQPLIHILSGTASFSGGTVTLDTGCAGNTAIKTDTLALSGGIAGSGYTNEDGSDTYVQKDGNIPVRFGVAPADYTKVDAALNQVKTLDKTLYKDFSAVEAAVSAVVRGKNTDEQAAVDAMAQAIESAIAALQYKDADYRAVDAAITKANALKKDNYKDFSAVESAVRAVVRGKNIAEQASVDAMAQAIESAIAALQYKDADYSAVDAAIAKANALSKDVYKDFSAVEAAISAVVRGKNITEQASVDAMAQAIESAIAALQYKDADYSAVDAAIAKANALSKDVYKDFSAVEAAISAVVRGKNITEQASVDAMAQAIEAAIAALEKKPIAEEPTHTQPENNDQSPQTNDGGNPTLWITLLFVSGGILTVASVRGRRKKYTVR